MSDPHYAFGVDVGQEAQRLAAVERALDPVSQAALRETGVSSGWRCWEVGAGRGSIARWLSQVVGPGGEVLATDLGGQWFDSAGSDIAFRRHDVVRDPVPKGKFDLIHARFLLEHLANPRTVMARLADALRPGGVLVLEDSAGLDLSVAPSNPALDHFAPAWERAGRTVGWNAAYGAELMSDLRTMGVLELRGRQCRQLAPGGHRWTHVALGIQRLEAELFEQGLSHEQLAGVLRCLADSANLIT